MENSPEEATNIAVSEQPNPETVESNSTQILDEQPKERKKAGRKSNVERAKLEAERSAAAASKMAEDSKKLTQKAKRSHHKKSAPALEGVDYSKSGKKKVAAARAISTALHHGPKALTDEQRQILNMMADYVRNLKPGEVPPIFPPKASKGTITKVTAPLMPKQLFMEATLGQEASQALLSKQASILIETIPDSQSLRLKIAPLPTIIGNEIEGQLAALRDQIAKYKSNYDNQSVVVEALRKELLEAKEAKEKLEGELTDKDTQRASDLDETVTYRATVLELQKKVAALLEDIKKKDASIANITTELGTKQSKYDELNTKYRELVNKIDDQVKASLEGRPSKEEYEGTLKERDEAQELARRKAAENTELHGHLNAARESIKRLKAASQEPINKEVKVILENEFLSDVKFRALDGAKQIQLVIKGNEILHTGAVERPTA